MEQPQQPKDDTPVTAFFKSHLAVHSMKQARCKRDKLEADKSFKALALARRSRLYIREADAFWRSCNAAHDEIQQELLENNATEDAVWDNSSAAKALLTTIFCSDADLVFKPSDFGLLKKLGQGGFGAVYKAIHYPTGHVVALKEVDAGSSNVETEDQRTLPLDCGIVPCYGTFLAAERTNVRKHPKKAGGAPKLKTWMVLKLCRNGSLADKLKDKGRLAPKEAARIVKRVSKILAPLYEEHELVHNDIKPANVLYDDDGSVLLCDLGCARKGPWQTGQRLGGTYAYMSPEKMMGRKRNNGRYHNEDKIDVWALGIMLCQMLFSKHPCFDIQRFARAPTLLPDQEKSDTKQMDDLLEKSYSKLTFPRTSDPKLTQLLQEMLASDFVERVSMQDIKRHPWIKRHDKWTKKIVLQLKTGLGLPTPRRGSKEDGMYKGEPTATDPISLWASHRVGSLSEG